MLTERGETHENNFVYGGTESKFWKQHYSKLKQMPWGGKLFHYAELGDSVDQQDGSVSLTGQTCRHICEGVSTLSYLRWEDPVGSTNS